MAKVFNPPTEIKVPEFNIETYEKDEEKFRNDLKENLLKRNPNGKNVGEIYRHQVGDGYAEYMIAGMKPLELVHIPLGDAWHFQYASRLTAKDVQAHLDFENHWKSAKKIKDIK